MKRRREEEEKRAVQEAEVSLKSHLYPYLYGLGRHLTVQDGLEGKVHSPVYQMIE